MPHVDCRDHHMTATTRQVHDLDPLRWAIYDPTWQATRILLKRGWNTADGVESRLLLIDTYLHSSGDSKTALWQVLNFFDVLTKNYSRRSDCDSALYDLITDYRAGIAYWYAHSP